MSDSLRSARPALRSTRTLGGRYIDIRVDRLAAARYGLSIDDVQTTAAAVGDMPVDEKLEGFARFPIIVRFPRETRDSLEALRVLPIVTAEGAIVLLTLPFALMGGIWLIYLFGHAFSVATAVGFIALAGLAAEFDVIMLVYLEAALMEGAVQRVRPKAMTAAVILAGLLPLLVSEGTGPEVMQRLAAPMVGSMITAPLLSLFVIPAIYKLLGFKRFHRQTAIDTELSPPGQTQTA